MKKRLLSLLLAVCLLVGLLPTVALAATQSNVTYLDVNGISQTCASATVVDSTTTTWNGGWYVVQGTVVISQGVTFSGDVHLILADNCDLTVENGIEGQGDLTVYAQSTGDAQGSMSAVGSPVMEGDKSVSRGIRVNGNFSITGGTVNAEGGNAESESIGIYVDEELSIDGGTVTAIGGDAKDSTGICVVKKLFSAGGTVTAIGGTADQSTGIIVGDDDKPDYGGDTIISSNANVTAIGGTAITISIGLYALNELFITGGTVNAKGGNAKSGSYGLWAYSVIATGGSITAIGATAEGSLGLFGFRVTISGGTVTAIGGTTSTTGRVDETMSCGIQVADDDNETDFGGYLNISGDAYVTAIGGDAGFISCAAFVQIGINMTGGYLLAEASLQASEHPSFYYDNLQLTNEGPYLWRIYEMNGFYDSTDRQYSYDKYYSYVEILCSYTEVTASDTEWTTGLYVVNRNVSIGNELFAAINPVTVTVTGDVRLILAGGHKLTVYGRIEVNEGNTLTIYGQTDAGDKLIVNNYSGSAGIGGRNGCSSGSITINGGTVTATSAGDSAAIGGGYSGTGYVTINGGKVTATSSGNSAAIGGGGAGTGYVTINGGKVTATSQGYGAGIGGGYLGAGYVTINGGTVTASSTSGPGIGGISGSTLSGSGDARIEASGIAANTENFQGTINGLAYYGVVVNGVQVTFANKSNVLPNNENGKVSYDADTNILTVDGYLGDLLNPVTTVIRGNGSTDVVLNGGGFIAAVGLTVTDAKNVTVTANSTSPAIPGSADITCSGDVTITNQNIAVYTTLTVKGAKNVTVTVNGDTPAILGDTNISCSGNVTITNEKYTATGGNVTVKAAKDVTITANAGDPAVNGDANITCSGEVQLVNHGGGKVIGGRLQIRKTVNSGYAVATGTDMETLTIYERLAACGIFGPEALDASAVKTVQLHTLTKTEAQPATCTARGNTEYWTCSECGKYFSDETGANEIAKNSWVIKAAHTLTKTEAQPATCTADGNAEYWTCSVCGKHFSDATGANEIEKDSWVIKAAHTLTKIQAKAATCTEDGNSEYWACSVCGKYFSDEAGANEIEKDSWVIKAPHTLTKTQAKAATCTENGNSEYWACSVCGKYFSDEAGTTEIEKDSWVISATGHSYSYAGNRDGTHTATCADCGNSFMEDHTFTDGSCVCGAKEITDEDGLKEALALGCTFIRLADDVTLSSTLALSDKIITLDLNGHTLTGNIQLADNSAAPNTILTLIDSNPAGGGVVNGRITLTRGSGSVSHLYANGGTITGQVSMPSYAGGIFCTSDTPTAFKDYVGNYGEIHGGMFYGRINEGCIKEKTVTFMNGGSRYALEVVADGSKVVAPASHPGKAGYAFVGWYDGDTAYTFGSTLSESITLTAEFGNPLNYDISYDLDGGTAVNPTIYTVESDAFTLNNPTKTGYTFTGWSGTGLSGNNNMTVTIPKGSTGSRSYTAHWTIATYTVTLNAGGGTINSGNVTGYTYGQGATLPTDVTKTGYTFAGWYDNAACTGDPVTAISATATGEKEYWAKWDANQYTITVESAENGSVTADRNTAAMGDTVTLTVVPETCYTPETLTVTDEDGDDIPVKDLGDGKYSFTMPASGVSIKVVFAENGHTLTKTEAKAATCTEEGNAEYWTCSDCGKYFSDEAGTAEIEKDSWVIAATGHSYSYTDNGDGTHTATCANCGDSFTEDHTFTDGTCVCGAVESTEPAVDNTISIGQQLSLESDLSLTFRIKESQLTNYDLSTAYLVVERDIYPTGGEMYVKTDTLTEYTIENSRLVFVYSGISAAQMNDEIRVTLHIKDSTGKDYVSNPLVTSVTAYAKLLLDAYGTTNAKLCTVLMDMLNYGTAAQIYFNRHADAPANTAYAEFANYASYASTDFVTPLEDLSSVLTNEGATATMNLSVELATQIGIVYKVTLPSDVNAADTTVVVKDTDGNELETLSLANATVDSKGRYVVTYFGTPSRLMRRVVYGTVYVGDTAISNTYGYSISTYAYQIANTAGMPETLVNLTDLMVMYGDAANAYFVG